MPAYSELTDFNDSRLDVFARLNENQLRHYYDPNGGLFIAESPKVTERALGAGCVPVAALVERSQAEGEAAEVLERLGDIPVFIGASDAIRKLTNIPMTRGILTCFKRPELPTVESICLGKRRIAVLENVTNPTNVGAIFRSAAALGMEAVLLNYACSDPLYRRASRVSMGTVFQIPWTYVENTEASLHKKTRLERWQEERASMLSGEVSEQAADCAKQSSELPDSGSEQAEDREQASYVVLLQKLGFKTVAMALTDRSVSIDDPNVCAEEKLAVILGAEGDGLTQETIDACDYTVKIPMSHGVDSLNVAAASAVAFWQLCR
jgi:tRNA G18 (ribose-2'-O)-methylase SpoU